jgi:hypothetical protein
VNEPGHRVLRQLLSGLGRPDQDVAGEHLSDAVLGDLAAGRTTHDAAQRPRAHLDRCLACLERFAALQAALTTPADVPPATQRPTATQLPAAVDEAIRDTHRAASAFGRITAESRQTGPAPGAWRAMPAASVAFMADASDLSTQEADPLLARLDAMATETNERLQQIWALRALVKKLRRLRRQIRKSDLPASRKAELRAALSEAEESLLSSLG